MMPEAETVSKPAVSNSPSTADAPASRVWLLTNAPSPYQSELFTAIACREEVALSVRFMRSSSSSGQAISSRFNTITMAALLPERFRDEIRLHPRAVWEAACGRFDYYVLSGLYTSVTFLCCAMILSIRRKPWALWLERPHRQDSPTYQSQTSLTGRLRDRVRSWLLRTSSRIICIGTAAKEEYQQLGAAPDQLDVLPYCCDLTRYDQVDASAIESLRSQYGLLGKCVFLFSGQMIDRKGVDTLLAAFARLADEDDSALLLLLGDGPRRTSLQESVPARHRDRIRFLGHLSQEELPVVFRAADVFVFPSRHDGWGVVINEACAAQLPIISTPQTGAAHDLIEPSVSGYRVDAGDTDGFYAAMQKLLKNSEGRQQMGQRSRELVEQFSPDRGAEMFVASVRRGVAGNRIARPTE